MPDANLKANQLDLGLTQYSDGLSKLALLGLTQQFFRCLKDIAITTAFEVKESKTLRKLVKEEIVEVLEAPRKDANVGLHRVKCRALNDLKEGWATLRGNQGTDFLESCRKPFYSCDTDVVLSGAFESNNTQKVRTLPQGEVLELLEGPRKEPPVETERIRVKDKDDKTGWITTKDAQGNANVEQTKLLICRKSIAITTTFDIAEGKALRKLEVAETLEIMEEAKEDEVRKLTRIRARSKKDSQEGWVTVKGNQGTAYVEETDQYYVCKRSVGLDKKFETNSTSVRMIEQGEPLEKLDGPQTETKEGENRARGRLLSDGSEGWFTLSGNHVSSWAPSYECVQSTVLQDGMDMKESKTVRKLEAGEKLAALEAPRCTNTSGIMRVRVRAEKDSAIGYATIRGNQGTVFLKSVLP